MSFDVFSNKFSQDVYLQKYSLDHQENWADTARRVVIAVCGQLLSKDEQQEIYQYIVDRKFIPGGRYLYSAGKPFHQVNNCFLFKVEDSREDWADLMQKVTASLMTGGGIGVEYSNLRPMGSPIKRTGGTSTGSLALMSMVNEAGRYIMQGGSRRSAIWAGLQWDHDDVQNFIKVKDYSESLRAAKQQDFTFPLPMELTNISIVYNTEFWIAIEDEKHPKHLLAKTVWYQNCKQAFSTAEPGMSFNFRKDAESLRNACVTGETEILTSDGYKRIDSVVDQAVEVWNGTEWSQVTPKITGTNAPIVTVVFSNGVTLDCTKYHEFHISGESGKIEAEDLCPGMKLIEHSLPDKAMQRDITITEVIDKGVVADVVYCFNEPKKHLGIFNGVITGQCCEVTSEHDSDKCNLGTLWINRMKDVKELRKVAKASTMFLLCGGIYSDVPTAKIGEIGVKNNRIGLGLGGIHEWLMTRHYDYEVVPELHKWLSVYEQESDSAAFIGAKQLGVSVPKGVRAIAPTGTIGIIAETTTGIESLFCKAYKRLYLKDKKWVHQFVVDGAVKRLLAAGVSIEQIKDSYDLSFKQRVKFQADVQNYVDMAISSTCNMPAWGSESNNEDSVESNANILLKYSKRLRGFTCYPDGCRDGQPLVRVTLEEALANEGTVFEANENSCLNGVCGV